MTDQPASEAVTVLFTDLEGSTDLRSRLGDDASQPLFDLHETIVRREVAAYGGREVKALGDGFMVAFGSARQALACAVSIQRRFEDHNRARPDRELHIRIGINSGEVLHHDDDLHGAAVHAAARIAGRAKGGEILVADVVRQLAGNMPALVLRDRGRVALKGFPERWRLYEVVWRSEGDERPRSVRRTAAATAPTSFLPVPPTPLQGRDREVAEVVDMLGRDDVRLVTITGPGGVGKTRVALAVATALAVDMADGAAFIALVDITDAELVVPTIAHGLGLRRTRGPGQLERVKLWLGGKELLLVLDNFEQVVAAGPVVGDLLAACPQLRVLVTSRAPLRLSGEHEYPVAPLPSAAAIALFIDRARAIRPTLDLSSASQGAIAEICARLDGLPLAIELAAACVRLFSLEAILDRLDDRLELLAGGARDLPTRQQTLRSTIEWSYELLDPAEQALFRRLSVFVGGFTLDSAAVVLGEATPDVALVRRLDSLVAQSLLQRTGEPGIEVRLGMLESISAYGREQLLAHQEEESTRQVHAAFFLQLAEEAEPKLMSADWEGWVDRLEREHDNLRAALRWCLDRDMGVWALRISGALSRFWFLHGDLREGRRWLGQSLAIGKDAEATVRVRALAGAGLLALEEHDYEAAVPLLEESLRLCVDADDKRRLAVVLGVHALAARYRLDYAAGMEFYGKAVALAREVNDRWLVAHFLEGLGNMAWNFAMDFETLRSALGESLTIFRELGDETGAAVTLQYLGWGAISSGDFAAATAHYDAAVPTLRTRRNRWGLAHALLGVGHLALEAGDIASARSHLHEAMQLMTVMDPKRALIFAVDVARLAVAAAEPEGGARLLGAIEALTGPDLQAIPVVFRRLHERALAEARRGLSDAAFESALAKGRSLSLEQTIAEAARLTTAPCGTERLTSRELEVLGLVADGLSNAEIATRLFVSDRTVHAHLRTIYRKLGVRSRTAAIRAAADHGLLVTR